MCALVCGGRLRLPFLSATSSSLWAAMASGASSQTRPAEPNLRSRALCALCALCALGDTHARAFPACNVAHIVAGRRSGYVQQFGTPWAMNSLLQATERSTASSCRLSECERMAGCCHDGPHALTGGKGCIAHRPFYLVALWRACTCVFC